MKPTTKARFEGILLLLVSTWMSGCGHVHSAMSSAIDVSLGQAGIKLPAEQKAQVASYATSQTSKINASIWPVDTMLIPPPQIILASEGSCQASAATPVASAIHVGIVVDGANSFSVMVNDVGTIGAVQEDLTLCWAACTQTLLRQQHISVDQKQLARQFVPDPDNEESQQAAGLGVITRALNPDLEPQVEKAGAVPISLLPVTSDQVINELMHGQLCIVGLMEDREANIGHACVICGAKFSLLKPSVTSGFNIPLADNHNLSPQEKSQSHPLNPVYGVSEITLFDPEPHFGIRHLTGQQFADQTVFIISHQISHQILSAALAAPQGYLVSGQLAVKSKNPTRAHAAITRLLKNQPPNHRKPPITRSPNHTGGTTPHDSNKQGTQ